MGSRVCVRTCTPLDPPWSPSQPLGVGVRGQESDEKSLSLSFTLCLGQGPPRPGARDRSVVGPSRELQDAGSLPGLHPLDASGTPHPTPQCDSQKCPRRGHVPWGAKWPWLRTAVVVEGLGSHSEP